MLAVLRRRDFGLLWLAGLVSVAGDWVLMAALPYVVYDRTGSGPGERAAHASVRRSWSGWSKGRPSPTK